MNNKETKTFNKEFSNKSNRFRNFVWTIVGIFLMFGLVFATTIISDTEIVTPKVNEVLYVTEGNANDIQVKIDLCNKSGCSIIIPPGNYDLNSRIYINHTNNLVIYGYGATITTSQVPATVPTAFTIINSSSITLKGMKFQDVETDIRLRADFGGKVEDITIEDIVSDKSGLTGSNFIYGIISFTTNDNSFDIVNPNHVDGVTIKNSLFREYFSDAGRSAPIYAHQDANYWNIENNHIENIYGDNEATGIALNRQREEFINASQYGHTIRSNTIINVTDGTPRGDCIYDKSSGATIDGNTIKFCNRFGITSLRGETQTSIINNHIWMNDTPSNQQAISIRITQSTWASGRNSSAFIAFNDIYNGKILLNTATSDNIVIGNRVVNPGFDGIDESNSKTSNNTIVFNLVQGTNEGDFTAPGTISFQNLGYTSKESNRLRGDVWFTDGNVTFSNRLIFGSESLYNDGSDTIFADGIIANNGMRVTNFQQNTGAAMDVDRNKNAANSDSAVITFVQNNNDDDQAVLYIQQDGLSNKAFGIDVRNDGNGSAIKIRSNTTTKNCNSDNEGGIYYDGNEDKHYGCDGTNWNAFY